jgi:transcriptional regulator GlxA family with amidase domain
VLSNVRQDRPPQRTRTRARHRQLAEEAKDAIAASLGESIGLQELGHRIGQSPFHLARVFRQETGYSLHEFRLQLRLRIALERLGDSVGSLTGLAIDLGFASHSHFTTAFGREFGKTPSEIRDTRDARRVLEAARPLAA